MNGRIFSAAEAAGLGLVSRVAATDELDQAVEDEVAPFLSCAPGAVADAKALCLHLARNPGTDQRTYTAERLADRWETNEAQAGIAAFFARRKPPWQST